MITEEITSLPVYPRLDEIADALATQGLLLLHAEPGAGKTTLVPWRLLTHEAFAGMKFILLQPRRIAARAAAERISSLLGETLGQTVGLRTRQETVVGPQTRLEVVTEGVVTRIIQRDPSLTGYGVVIFDEVFVPWERVFLAGECEQGGLLTTSYATHHRHSCIAARAGFGDLLIGEGYRMIQECRMANDLKVAMLRAAHVAPESVDV